MTSYKEVRSLIIKDIRIEIKQKYAINGILLYIISTIFLCSMAFGGMIDQETWNVLFWIVLLFGSVNALSKSFVQESQGRHYYYYTLASPQSVIIAKMAYNILLMLLLSVLFIVAFTVFLGNFIQDQLLFYTCVILGGTGFATFFTMISAIASRTNNNSALTSVLGFPLILPLLTLLIRTSKTALLSNNTPGHWPELLALSGLIIITITLSTLLFPYLWRD